VVVEHLRSRTDLDLAHGNCTCCTDDDEEFFALANPLANSVAAHNPRASQVDLNAIPSRASQVDPNAICTHLHTCWLDKSRLKNIDPLAMTVKSSKTPTAERDGSKQSLSGAGAAADGS